MTDPLMIDEMLYSKWLEALPPGIGQLHSLVKLDLRMNAIQDLPPSIADCTALQVWSHAQLTCQRNAIQ